MSTFAAPLQIATVSLAVLWPVGTGLALVLWTRARAAERVRRLAAIEHGLQGLFRSIESQAAPGRLELVVDALAEQAAIGPPAKAGSAGRRRKAAPTN